MTDIDTPYQHIGASFSETSTRSTARRLRRTRQHLGSYRYNLLVALRVVNKVEREIMIAEWENWLLDENTRCKQIQTMLHEDRTNSLPSKGVDSQQVQSTKEKNRLSRMETLRQWQEGYCGSCQREQEAMLNRRKSLMY